MATSGRLHLAPLLSTLALFSAYLTTGSLTNSRSSPPWFFTISLALVGTALRPSFLTAILSVAVAIPGLIFFALDHIHGECWYDVLTGGETWHKNRLGELGWYRTCIQASQAWWIMAVLAFLWSIICLVEVYDRLWKKRSVALPVDDDSEE